MNDMGDEILHLDPKREAADMIDRAFTNLWRLEEDLDEFEKIWKKIESRG
jgi:hypothetical protein